MRIYVFSVVHKGYTARIGSSPTQRFTNTRRMNDGPGDRGRPRCPPVAPGTTTRSCAMATHLQEMPKPLCPPAKARVSGLGTTQSTTRSFSSNESEMKSRPPPLRRRGASGSQ